MMSYLTRCTCTDYQLAQVGCDCDHTGPEREVLTYDEQEAQQREAELQAMIEREAAEADYWEARIAEDQIIIEDPREDYHSFIIAAERHQ